MITKSLEVMSQYSTNLTDKQWQVIEKTLIRKKTAKTSTSRDYGRHPLHQQDRLSVANAAKQLRPLADLLLLLPEMKVGGRHRGHHGHHSFLGPEDSRTGGKPQHGDYRFAQCKNVSSCGFR